MIGLKGKASEERIQFNILHLLLVV